MPRIREGLPHLPGATWDGEGVNFSLFSANANKVELCLFDSEGKSEIERIELPEYTDQFFHGWVGDLLPGQVTAIVCMVRMNPTRDIALIQTNS
jgi:isoamylase